MSAHGAGPPHYIHMLHRQVMVIARMRVEGTWKAYCFPVPGLNHDDEEYLWEIDGVQLNEKEARSMFGFLENVPYSR
tara:strand:+ start:376 stop:606 length:231 start_codon:yes stop_codon:yes gene_type:complete